MIQGGVPCAGWNNFKALAERIILDTKQTMQMKRGVQMEFHAANEYSKCTNVNYQPCDLVSHPETPWLGASVDGLVFDPSATPQFGLVEIKCPNVKWFVECKYLTMADGTFKLKTRHAYFWQVQGQLLLTGLKWCDFFVWAEEDIVERVPANKVVQQNIRQKGDSFYFNIYMPKYLEVKKNQSLLMTIICRKWLGVGLNQPTMVYNQAWLQIIQFLTTNVFYPDNWLFWLFVNE